MISKKYSILLSNTAIFAVGNILVKIISFFLMPLYTSVLTTEQYGVSELLNNTIEILLPVMTGCIIEAVYRFAIDQDVSHRDIFSYAFRIILISDILVLIGTGISFYFLHYEYAFSFFFLYFTNTFYRLTTQFARGLGHAKYYAFYGVLNSLILVISNIVLLVIFNGGVNAYLASFSVGYGVAGITAFILSKEYLFIKFRSLDRKVLNEMIIYSLPLIPNLISWWINSLSGRYVVLLYWGAGVAGLYTAASKLPAMINLVSSIFQQAWQYSTATEIHSRNQEKFFSNVLRVYMYICTVSCAILILFNKFISSILLQKEFYEAWQFIPLLLLAATLGCISTYFGTFYQALKSNIMLMVSTVLGAIVNLIFNFFLIPLYGGIGAAIAMVLGYFVVAIMRLIDVRKKVEITLNKVKCIVQVGVLVILALLETQDLTINQQIFCYVLVLVIIATEARDIFNISKKIIK